MEEKREKQFRRIICCLLPLCLFLVWVNILPVSAQTQLSASAQIQSAAPWGTETVKETRAYYDGAYWRVPAGWYHYQPTKDVWKDLLVSNSEDYFTDYYVAVWKKADGGYELEMWHIRFREVRASVSAGTRTWIIIFRLFQTAKKHFDWMSAGHLKLQDRKFQAM